MEEGNPRRGWKTLQLAHGAFKQATGTSAQVKPSESGKQLRTSEVTTHTYIYIYINTDITET